MIRVEVQCPVPPRANNDGQRGGHWRDRARLVKQQRQLVTLALAAFRRRLREHGAWTVRLTRVSPRKIDSDGASAAMKAPRDAVAEVLGVDDADERVTWLPVEQAKDGRPRYQAVRIEVWPGQARCECCGQAVAP
jgi:hypothetical protein